MARSSKSQDTKVRAAERERLLAMAREQKLASSWEVCVLGGGASGLAAAITAAEAGASVLVLERDIACGRSILATGNGRCNFANKNLAPSNYLNPDFVDAVMGADPLSDILDFFRASGLVWTEEEGRLYPRSLVAASVRDVLLDRAYRAGVVCASARKVVALQHEEDGTHIEFQELWEEGRLSSLTARCVVAAFGGPLPHIEGLELSTTIMRPVLCALRCQTQRLGSLDGRRARCTARILRDDELIHEETGEILFRRMGLSGILSYDLSRYAHMGDVISLDLVPETSSEDIVELIHTHSVQALAGLLDPVIVATIQELADLRMEDGDTTEKDLAQEISQLIKNFTARVIGTMDEEHAQVTRGGLATNQFSTETLESHELPGMYACGEALDVDGACGGYNLAWAWKSGMVAGKAAANKALGR